MTKPSPTVRRITHLDIPGLEPYLTLRRPEQHKVEGIFVAEGEKVVRRLLSSGIPVLSILLTTEWYARLFPDATSLPCDVYVAEHALLETITGVRLHQGIMAVGRVPQERTLEEELRGLDRPCLLVALDGVVQVENLGVIARTCAAFGVQVLLVGENSCSPYLRRAVRNSMGAVFQLRCIHTPNLRESLTWLRDSCGVHPIVAVPGSQSLLSGVDLTGDICLILGNEDAGISPEVAALAGQSVAIPIRLGIDSINVASASAVLLYEVSEQRRPGSRRS